MNSLRRIFRQKIHSFSSQSTNDIIYKFKKNLNQVTADASRLKLEQSQLMEDQNNRLLLRIAEAFFKNEQDLLCYRFNQQTADLEPNTNCP